MHRLCGLIVEALLPFRCFRCDRLYRPAPAPLAAEEDEVSVFGRLFIKFLCPDCRKEYTPIRSPSCTHCGLPFGGAGGPDHLCGMCEKHPFHFRSARSAGAYDTALQAMIHLLKYRAHAQVAIPLGRLLWKTFLRNWRPQEFDAIIPVPLHPKRLRRRGFNQAALLMREWPKLASAAGIPLGKETIVTDGLIKIESTDPQAGLNRLQRSSNLKRAFGLAKGFNVKGKKIMLIDDVMTTGATADQCSRTLLSAGAESVSVLTLARAV